MILTDTHCHLDFEKFDPDREAVIERARSVGLIRILIPALHWNSSLAAVKWAESHPMLFAAIGFHPTELEQWDDSSLEQLSQLASTSPKVIAIGEIGLDYYWVSDPEQQARQRQIFRAQLELARQVNKPVIIHMREANDAWSGPASADLLAILSEWHARLLTEKHPLAQAPGVLHSFNGNLETAQKALSMNFYIGITGPVTYKNAEQKRQMIAQLPLERLLLETDAPFLTPVPHRGKRNEPAYVRHIADKIAEIHSKHPEEVAAITSMNATRLFAWGE
jgi:TatD DNase family protein